MAPGAGCLDAHERSLVLCWFCPDCCDYIGPGDSHDCELKENPNRPAIDFAGPTQSLYASLCVRLRELELAIDGGEYQEAARDDVKRALLLVEQLRAMKLE